MERHSLSRRYLTACACVALVAVVLLALWSASDVLLLAFAGVLTAIVFRTLANVIVRYTGIGAGWALAIVLILGAALLASFAFIAGPTVMSQFAELRIELPAAWDRTRGTLSEYGWGRDLLSYTPDLSAVLSKGTRLWSRLIGVVSTSVAVLADIVVIGFLGLYFAADPCTEGGFWLWFLPQKRNEADKCSTAFTASFAIGCSASWP